MNLSKVLLNKRWLTAAWYGQVIAFLGRPAVILFGLSGIVALFLYIVELGFAYSIQSLFRNLKILTMTAAPMPSFLGWLTIDSLQAALVLVLAVGIMRALLYWSQTYFTAAIREHLKYRMRSWIVRWVFRSESVSSGYAASLFNERLINSISGITTIQEIFAKTVTVTAFFFQLVFMSWKTTTLVFLILAGLAVATRAFDKRVRQIANSLKSESDNLNRHFFMTIKNLLLIQIYGTHQEEELKADRSLQTFRNSYLHYAVLSGLKYAIPQIAGVALICIIVLLMQSDPEAKATILIPYLYLFLRFVQDLADISKNNSNLSFFWPFLNDMIQWWQKAYVPVSTSAPEADQRVKQIESPISWSLRNVSFSYPQSLHKIIDCLNLDLNAGETLVIVGPSGVGKSTLLNILLGVSKPQSGQVTVRLGSGSPAPLADVKDVISKNIGYVGPESFLLDGTVRENLTYGLTKKVTDDDLFEALNIAKCQFVFDQRQGLDTNITEQGHGFSAGQKQRLSLARALLRKPKALILDEATANIDDQTEADLVQTLMSIKGQITMIIVTHKIGLLKLADKKLSLESKIDTLRRVIRQPEA